MRRILGRVVGPRKDSCQVKKAGVNEVTPARISMLIGFVQSFQPRNLVPRATRLNLLNGRVQRDFDRLRQLRQVSLSDGIRTLFFIQHSQNLTQLNHTQSCNI